MSELDLSGILPLWSVEIYHTDVKEGAINPWFRVVNAVTEDAARETALEIFKQEGLTQVAIYRIVIGELLTFGEGGEDGN